MTDVLERAKRSISSWRRECPITFAAGISLVEDLADEVEKLREAVEKVREYCNIMKKPIEPEDCCELSVDMADQLTAKRILSYLPDEVPK